MNKLFRFEIEMEMVDGDEEKRRQQVNSQCAYHML